ncbi:hypothetical protein D3C74_433960 [compost metagenome]
MLLQNPVQQKIHLIQLPWLQREHPLVEHFFAEERLQIEQGLKSRQELQLRQLQQLIGMEHYIDVLNILHIFVAVGDIAVNKKYLPRRNGILPSFDDMNRTPLQNDHYL